MRGLDRRETGLRILRKEWLRFAEATVIGALLPLPLLLLFVFAIGVARGGENSETFDAAAKLYEQGKFREAAAAYDRLIASETPTVSVYFNQGNAWFKAGEKGRAIAAYRRALRLAPRDPEVTANLEWVRSKVQGTVAGKAGMVDGLIGMLTANEWAFMAISGVWGWFGLMMARALVPRFRNLSGGWGWAFAGVVALTMVAAYLARSRHLQHSAVVVATEATVRFGPLEEAQSAFTLTDGTELVVTDRKGAWVEIRDTNRRRGWIAERHLSMIP